MSTASLQREPAEQHGLARVFLARPMPASLVLAVAARSSLFDSIEKVIIDAVVDGRCDPEVARGLLYAATETAPC